MREIFFVSTDRALMAVEVEAGTELAFGKPTELFRLAVGGGPTDARDHYSASADGQRFLIDGAAESAHRSPITLLVNWTALTSEAVPGSAANPSRLLH
jgi:hypothetical protein